jgi:hypothetical protein
MINALMRLIISESGTEQKSGRQFCGGKKEYILVPTTPGEITII